MKLNKPFWPGNDGDIGNGCSSTEEEDSLTESAQGNHLQPAP